MLMAVCGMRRAMGQDFGIVSCERAFLMRQRLHAVLQSMLCGSRHGAHMEGVLLVASRHGCSRPDRPESTMKGVAGVDKMSMVHAKG